MVNTNSTRMSATYWLQRVLSVFVFGIVLSSCASVPPGPESTTRLSDGQGVVLGRVVTTLNGTVTRLPKEAVLMHVSPYRGDDELTKNAFAPGKWMLRADASEDGYFAAVLPSGQYYFVEIIYLNSVPKAGTGFRTYMNIPGANASRRSVWTFEVLPGKVTYVGTMMHNFSNVVNGLINSSGSINVQLVNESVLAKERHSARESQHLEFEVRLADSHQLP